MRKILNIPNVLSAIRILLIPLFIVLFFQDKLIPAMAVLLISGITDVADGFIARKFKLETALGKVLDPVADKLTQGAVIICVTIRHPAILPLLAILVLKEVLMLIGAVVLYRKGLRPSPAKWFGKLSSGVLYLAMVLLVLNQITTFLNPLTAGILVFVACTSILLSVVCYYSVFKDIKKKDSENLTVKS